MSDGHYRLNRSAGNTGSKRKKNVSYVYYESFEGARAIVRKLKLKGLKGWREWTKSGQRPSNIPSTPDKVYRDNGWISFPDWLGYGKGRPAQAVGKMLPFAVARAIVRKRKLKGLKGWREWSKSGQRPSNIPSNPDEVYRGASWISMPDWLGYGKGRQARVRAVGKMLPFAAARAIVRKLKLTGTGEWRAWSKSGQRPSNIPSNPNNAYRGAGWISMAHWLGYGRGKARAKGRGWEKKKAGGCTAGAAGDSKGNN
jgi:hypothetical protein